MTTYLFPFFEEEMYRNIPAWFKIPQHVNFIHGYCVPSDIYERYHLVECLTHFENELNDFILKLNYSNNDIVIQIILDCIAKHKELCLSEEF